MERVVGKDIFNLSNLVYGNRFWWDDKEYLIIKLPGADFGDSVYAADLSTGGIRPFLRNMKVYVHHARFYVEEEEEYD